MGAEVHADRMFDDVHNKLPRSVMLELAIVLLCYIFTFVDYDKHVFDFQSLFYTKICN